MKRVIVYGGLGNLGYACTNFFKSKGYVVGFVENPLADSSIVLTRSDSMNEQKETMKAKLIDHPEKRYIDAVICVAGGWHGGNLNHKTANIASERLVSGGILVLSGASAALSVTPSMLGYGMAKSAVHHLTQSLAEKSSGFPSDCTATAILPDILDTEANRKVMPKADRSNWTPLDVLTNTIYNWIEGINRPKSGSLVRFITRDGQTTTEVIE